MAVRFIVVLTLMLAAATSWSSANAAEMFNFLAPGATEVEVKMTAQMAVNDPSQLGYHSTGTPGQRDFDDFSFAICNLFHSSHAPRSSFTSRLLNRTSISVVTPRFDEGLYPLRN
jgi:hypothetical protein